MLSSPEPDATKCLLWGGTCCVGSFGAIEAGVVVVLVIVPFGTLGGAEIAAHPQDERRPGIPE